ncbi:hypothetical protein [uncultured Tenacibaculum sp.]|uniref:hypothetical protein n=1 Tax=uncultured Tenacibaculum sp. TaxID=174713 RepID=UPI0026207839|nr:hypothetical protein [uncultured Tenacibaculum sp.]
MTFLFANLLTDGGPLYMYTILVLLLICIFFLVTAFIKGDDDGKLQKLISHVSLLALVWGFLGFMIGMIEAMDAIAVAIDFSSGVLAGGLKIALLSPCFGMLAFIIARLGIIGLTLKKK